MKKTALIIFIVASVGVLLSGYVPAGPTLHVVCKPLIMLALMAYYPLSAGTARSGVVVAAIAFSWLGDTFLMLETYNPLYFMLGLSSFLVAHVLYIFAYRQHRTETWETALEGVQKIRFALPIVLAGTGLVVILYPRLGALKFPVLLYALVLVLMVLQALLRYGRTVPASYWLVFLGALLFMVSDSLLAINKFLAPVAHAGLLIMATYCAAQYSIVTGLLKHRP